MPGRASILQKYILEIIRAIFHGLFRISSVDVFDDENQLYMFGENRIHRKTLECSKKDR